MWETDQPPVNYLKRRIIYYKKKIGRTKNIIHNEIMFEKYGQKELSAIITRAVEHYEKRIKQFKSSIKKLQN